MPSLAPLARAPTYSGQFDNFMALAKWLFHEANREFTTDKFDDPNTTYVTRTVRCRCGAVQRSLTLTSSAAAV